jgi:hypothetical protein
MYNDTVNLFQSKLSRDCPRAGRIAKRDILAVIKAAGSGDYSKVWKTKLYTRQGGAYCRLLEYINADLPNLFPEAVSNG